MKHNDSLQGVQGEKHNEMIQPYLTMKSIFFPHRRTLVFSRIWTIQILLQEFNKNVLNLKRKIQMASIIFIPALLALCLVLCWWGPELSTTLGWVGCRCSFLRKAWFLRACDRHRATCYAKEQDYFSTPVFNTSESRSESLLQKEETHMTKVRGMNRNQEKARLWPGFATFQPSSHV